MDSEFNTMGSNSTRHMSEWAPFAVSLTLADACLVFSIYAGISAWRSSKHAASQAVKDASPLLDSSETVASDTKKGSGRKHNNNDLEAAAVEREALLAWSGLSCTYPSTNAGQEEKQTLTNAYGELRAGDLMAIMGPSGGGKSTLMDILAGRKETGNIKGALRVPGGHTMINDFSNAEKLLKDITAYVPQELMFFPMQTPEEAVMFVAGLKHGDSNLLEARRLLYDVGLRDPDLYTRPIGGSLAGGFEVRGLSGGERKRLALACALAMKPRLIMLDEITSGLDSESALLTLKLLKDLCVSHGVAAIVIIHQPDGYVFDCFNRLLLLSKGRCVYSDHLANIESLYDKHFGCRKPESKHELPLDLLRRLKALPADAVFPCPDTDLQESGATFSVRSSNTVSSFRKLGIVFQRNLMNHYVRNVTNLFARLVCYTACSLLDGALFWKVGINGSLPSVVGAFTFISLISYLLPFGAIPVFTHEKKFFLFERSLGLYSPWIYCVSQTLLESWVLILAACVEASIVIPMCGLWNADVPKWESFLTLLSALMASGLTGSALVLFFSILMPSQDLAFLIGSGVVCLALGMSGGFVPFPEMESFITWLQWISPCKYSVQALLIGYASAEDSIAVQSLDFDRPATVSANIGVLFLMFAILALGTMLVLSRQREVR